MRTQWTLVSMVQCAHRLNRAEAESLAESRLQRSSTTVLCQASPVLRRSKRTPWRRTDTLRAVG